VWFNHVGLMSYHIYIYIYIYRERERERDVETREGEPLVVECM
jgi:hypothetical protein